MESRRSRPSRSATPATDRELAAERGCGYHGGRQPRGKPLERLLGPSVSGKSRDTRSRCDVPRSCTPKGGRADEPDRCSSSPPRVVEAEIGDDDRGGRALVRRSRSRSSVSRRPIPVAGEVLVRIEASGLCHTDIHAAHGDWPVKPSPPFIPGHEGVGIVEGAGRGVTSVARRVTASPFRGSAMRAAPASYCISGWETLCDAQRNTGYSHRRWLRRVRAGARRYVVRVPTGSTPSRPRRSPARA